MPADVLPLVFAGFGLGLIHALDADHIMAVSVLSSEPNACRRVGASLRQSAAWALGHGAVLLALGILLFGFGLAIPAGLQHAAEVSVGIVLIVLGLLCIRQVRCERLTLSCHRHGAIVHTHWQPDKGQHASTHNHKPVLVGMLHGLAGSAPALALIPAVSGGQLLSALCYLALFSAGVMLAMLCFGLGLARVQRLLSERYQAVFKGARQTLAVTTIVFGGYWIVQAA